MSTSAALVLFAPAEARLPARADRRYRAGIVLEPLEVRRVLSAAAAAVAMPDQPADYVTVVVTAGPTEDTGGDAADYQPWDASTDPADLQQMLAALGGDDSPDAPDDSGIAWPEGWGWSLDRLPTQDEIDAANNGDDLAGLWVPVRNFGPDGDDPVVDDGSTDGGGGDDAWIAETGGEVDPTLFNGAPGPVAGHVVFNSRDELPNQRTPVSAPAPTAQDPAPAASGAPVPLVFNAAPPTNALLLGKLKSGVTDDDPSDLPFMN